MVNADNPPSQAAIGRALGLSPAAMTKLKKQGMPVDSVESAQAWRVERQNVAQRKPVPVAAPPMAPWPGALDHEDDNLPVGMPDESFESARIRRTIAEANLAELEESRIKGLHVEKSKVDAAFFEAARGLRDGMTNCSRRLAAEVATHGDPHTCEAIISKELRHLLESFIQNLNQKMSTPRTEDMGL